MTMTKEEKRLLEAARKLEGRSCREMLISQAEAMCRAQEALKADYGIAEPDVPVAAASA
jgi:hypothetical protein